MHRGRQTECVIWRSYANHKHILHYLKRPLFKFAVSSGRLDQSSSMLVRRSIGFNGANPSDVPVVEVQDYCMHAMTSSLSCVSWLIRRLGLFNHLVMSGFITLNQCKWVYEVVICRPLTVHSWHSELLGSATFLQFGTTTSSAKYYPKSKHRRRVYSKILTNYCSQYMFETLLLWFLCKM